MKVGKKKDQLHGSGGISDPTSFIGRKMVGRRVRSTVKVKEGVANIVLEGVADGTAAFVPDGALVERCGLSSVKGRGGRGGGAWGSSPAK